MFIFISIILSLGMFFNCSGVLISLGLQEVSDVESNLLAGWLPLDAEDLLVTQELEADRLVGRFGVRRLRPRLR